MNTQRFYIKPSNEVPNAGYRQIPLGLPDPSAMMNDLCITARGSYDFIPLNSIILREALLNSAEFLEKYLMLEVKPIERKQQVKETKPEVVEESKKVSIPVNPNKIKKENK